MKKSKFLKKGSIIGVCAPSSGFEEKPFVDMCNLSKEKLNNLGYEVKFSESCFNNLHGRSNTKKKRSEEFLNLYFNDEIDIIISLSGGEYEMEILDELNLNKIKRCSKPKLFCGCSDNSILTFLMTTYCDLKTVYGHNFYEICIEHKVIDDYLEFLSGKSVLNKEIVNVSKNDYSWNMQEAQTKYIIDYKNHWKVKPDIKVDVTGMVIGGLLDDLIHICGTKYDKTKKFIKKYSEYGFIWYFDICTIEPEIVKRSFWQLKNAGWFKNAKAIIIGRPINQSDSFGITYYDNIYDELSSLNIPIIFDYNVGHIPPSYHFYNGSIARLLIDSEEKSLEYLKDD